MTELFESVFIGSQEDCVQGTPDLRVIHACKYPCYSAQTEGKNPGKTHPNYLSSEKPDNLYLNILDPEKPLFLMESFWAARRFCCESDEDVLVHCNQGRSRAVVIGLLCGVWRGLISPAPWESAILDNTFHVPVSLGRGIRVFMRQNWDELCNVI
jgi:hypothetical protein